MRLQAEVYGLFRALKQLRVFSRSLLSRGQYTCLDMRYTESREKSAELLRVALRLMNEHAAALNPVTYTVWYEYASGANAQLNQALDRLCQTQPKLDDAAMQQLYSEHIADVDENAMESISRELLRVMTNMAEKAQGTSARAEDFGLQLGKFTHALQSQNADTLRKQVQQVMVQTESMQYSATELQAQVASSREEIDRLRTDLENAREDALTDGLTRVLNRKGLQHHLDQLLSQPLAQGDTHSLVMLDIDHFKQINDNHGHLMGDNVLTAIGELLRRTMAKPEQLVGRWGGEEFLLLLPHTPLTQSTEVAEKVRALTKAIKLRNRTSQEVMMVVTVSAGIASLRPGEDAHDWIARADAALYQSKQGGRDRVTCAA